MRGTSLLAALFAAGCAQPTEEPCRSAPFAMGDSAGVEVASTGGCEALRPLGWEVELRPDVSLGGEASEPASQFFRIRGARQLANGMLAVVDGGDMATRFFRVDGEFLFSLGTEGRGPGEFMNPVLLGTSPPEARSDSLGVLLFDRTLSRLSWASAGGGIEAEMPVRLGRPGRVVGWIGGSLVVRRLGASVTGMVGLLPEPGAEALLLVDPGTGRERLVTRITPVPSFGYPLDGRIVNDFVPFEVPVRHAVGRDRLVLIDGKLPQLREYDPGGGLRRIIRVEMATRQATERDLDAYIEVQRQRSTTRAAAAQIEDAIRGLPWRREMPVFDEIVLDADGFTWARLYGFDPAVPRRWVVFAPEGMALGTVDTPPGLAVQQVGGDFILGVTSDSLDVEHLRRHRLRRGLDASHDRER